MKIFWIILGVLIYSISVLRGAELDGASAVDREKVRVLLSEIKEKQQELAKALSLRRKEAKDISDIYDIIEFASMEVNAPRDQLMATIGSVLGKKPDAIFEMDSERLTQMGKCMSGRSPGGMLLCSIIVDSYIITEFKPGYKFDARYYEKLRSPDNSFSLLITEAVTRAQFHALALAFVEDVKKKKAGEATEEMNNTGQP